MLSKKHYTKVASIIKEQSDKYTSGNVNLKGDAPLMQIAKELDAYFADDNPNFNSNRFIAACGDNVADYLFSQ